MTKEIVTLSMRIFSFGLSLGIMGAFLLPWVKIDGVQDGVSGVGVIALVASPTGQYLYLAAPVQAAALIGATIVILLAGLVVVSQYANRRRAILATLITLVCACALPFAARDILVSASPQVGLGLVISFAGILLVQQMLIKVATLLGRKEKLPRLYRGLRVITGSGVYRWGET